MIGTWYFHQGIELCFISCAFIFNLYFTTTWITSAFYHTKVICYSNSRPSQIRSHKMAAEKLLGHIIEQAIKKGIPQQFVCVSIKGQFLSVHKLYLLIFPWKEGLILRGYLTVAFYLSISAKFLKSPFFGQQ